MIPDSPKDFHSSPELNGKELQIQGEFKYPRIIEIKIFLKAMENGESKLRELLSEKCPEEGIMSISCRSSKSGKYHSFTCRIWIVSENELEVMHEHLSSQEQVLYLL